MGRAELNASSQVFSTHLMYPSNTHIFCLLIGLYQTNAAVTYSNTSELQADYRVRWTSNCSTDSPVVPHFEVASGTVCTLDGGPLTALSRGESRDFAVSLDHTYNISSWRTWIDASFDYTAKTNSSTLVELTRNDTPEHSVYFADVSVIDAATYWVEVRSPTSDTGECTQVHNGTESSCQNIICKAPTEWQCPAQNRFDFNENGEYLSHSYLDANQSCVSNCTLLQTDEACCRGEYASPEACPNPNPELKKACGEGYSYAFDDASATFTWTLPLQADSLIEIVACP